MRYFIGYALSGDDKAKVDLLRNAIAEMFNVHGALKIPAHMTLMAPFEISSPFKILAETLDKYANEQTAFDLNIIKYAHFGQDVWFLEPEQPAECFNLHSSILKVMKTSFEELKDFKDKMEVHFHITLAYKDLTKDSFEAIGKYLAQSPLPISKLKINAITLFEWQRDDSWKIVRTFPFKTNA